MKNILKSSAISTGLAMFAMFFGAGNVVFPLAIGVEAQGLTHFAMLGLVLTAVCIPFIGLTTMIYFDGSYRNFFNRIGAVPGFAIAALIMAIIGPFGALPRTVALSYSTLSLFAPQIDLYLFCFISCCIIFFFAFKPTRILDIIGYVLTPLLVVCLGVIIVKGLIQSSEVPVVNGTVWHTFFSGLKEGYQTMDLLGAFFFSTVVLLGLKSDLKHSSKEDKKNLIKVALQATVIGATLLTLIYIGFGYLASYSASTLESVSQDKLLPQIAIQVLGPYAGIFASAAVALACLTTAIALATVFSEFLHRDITKGRLTYLQSLIFTLIVTFGISTLEFSGIVSFLAPVLAVFYPSLIVLTALNFAHKVWGTKIVKTPVYATFVLSVISELMY